ncbi:MAG: FAD:protein FMN transferase [Methylococcus sp.]|nr:MAG: FAD:protein FMN transferase [Methylococcus sp.]
MALYRRDFHAMGSPCEIQLYAKSRSRAQHVLNRLTSEIQRLEARYSRYRDDSFLKTINRVAAEGGAITVDDETAGLLSYVATCYQESDGLFDVTSGLLRKAWSFKDNRLPLDDEIQPLLERVGWNKLSWEPPVLSFPMAGMELDFGGAVKEYAVDRVTSLCWESEVYHGLVNLGGDIRVIGPHPDGTPWAIGITHPRIPGAFITRLPLTQGALATSGDYERCIEWEGVRYGHILDPRTGWPVRRLAAVSVLADLCVVAGSASTIGMLKDFGGSDWLQQQGFPHYWVDVDGHVGGSLLTGP